MQRRVFQLIVDNTSGVLSRISGLFSRRGYNIESITAGVTADPRFTRITIVATGDEQILAQIEKQDFILCLLNQVIYKTDSYGNQKMDSGGGIALTRVAA